MMIVVSVLVLILGVGAGVGVRLYQDKHKEPPLPPLPTDVAKSQNLALKGDFAGADAEITKALAAAKTPQEKYDLLYQQGTNYQNQGNNTAALQSLLNADKIKSTQGLSESIALLAEKLGDKNTAITYFKKAISLIPSGSPVKDSVKADYEQHITDLGGTL